ncbi:MAG: RNA-binding S4 domain-containing protein [Parvularculaceae bacterium]|nr:RNA-binding S4 domain-containing protein [Parvularculaceae bacterium]
MSADAGQAPSRRLDKWLWCVRQFKTRSLAAKFISGASVRVTRKGATQRIDKPGFILCVGDDVSFILGERLIALRVLGFAARRGPAQEARALFADRAASRKGQNAPAGEPCKAAR